LGVKNSSSFIFNFERVKKFVLKTLMFSSPFLLAIVLVFIADPFRVWFSYDHYYENYPVTLNREDVCLKLYNRGRDEHKYNSFIFGSSRSQAFKTINWKPYLESSASPFHFDASGEGIYGILNKLRYLDDLNTPIRNALIVLDESCMKTNFNRKGHLFISPPTLSKESRFVYNKEFVTASLNVKFIYAFIDYQITKKHKGYMGTVISRITAKANMINGDVFYWSYDEGIRKDSLSYYSGLIRKGVFVRKEKMRSGKNESVTEVERKQLAGIAEILKKHRTKFRIVVSPLYDQIPLSSERLELLESLFGKENVHNFSGKNQFTEVIGNYYDGSHYRPHVADEILRVIYENNGYTSGLTGSGEQWPDKKELRQ
jgi:hypothetical protein